MLKEILSLPSDVHISRIMAKAATKILTKHADRMILPTLTCVAWSQNAEDIALR